MTKSMLERLAMPSEKKSDPDDDGCVAINVPPPVAEAACDVEDAEPPVPRAMRRWMKRHDLTGQMDGFALEIPVAKFDRMFPSEVYCRGNADGSETRWTWIEEDGFTIKVWCRVEAPQGEKPIDWTRPLETLGGLPARLVETLPHGRRCEIDSPNYGGIRWFYLNDGRMGGYEEEPTHNRHLRNKVQNREEPVSDTPPSAIRWHTHNAKLGEFLMACYAVGAEVLDIDYAGLRVRVDAAGFRKLVGESYWDEVLKAMFGHWEMSHKRGDVLFWATETYEPHKSRRVRTETI